MKPGDREQGEEFPGATKANRPAKGGGSVSGKLWNNREAAIVVRAPREEQGGEYRGAIKLKRQAKGGGNISGILWNNKETPIEVRAPKETQGGEFSGSIKAKRGYVKNDYASALALRKLKPTKATYQTGNLQVKVKESYTRNPNWADEALKVKEPGKAFGRSGDFQGNIKMHKFELFAKRDLHPDAKFVKTNKNNVAEEKDMLTNFKLWWARLFKKNDTQPDHLKDKGGKPRYDKGEQGLWYD